MSDSSPGGADEADRRALRQQRLQQLRGAVGGGRGAGGGDEAQAQRRRALGRAVRILTETPDDGRGLVEGTPFTCAGVAALMAQLHQRAGNAGAPGARVATRLLGLLTGGETGADAVEGVSRDKLQRLAKLASNAGGGAQRRRQGL